MNIYKKNRAGAHSTQGALETGPISKSAIVQSENGYDASGGSSGVVVNVARQALFLRTPIASRSFSVPTSTSVQASSDAHPQLHLHAPCFDMNRG